MDLGAMNEATRAMIGLFRVGEVLVDYLPLAASVLTAAVTLTMFCRDRYRRRVSLAPAPEEERLLALRENGSISDAEAALLREHCNALPELTVLSPVPDLPLRLAAAFSRIYAAMQLFAFTGVLLFAVLCGVLKLAGLPLTLQGDGATVRYLPLGLALLLLTASVVQWRAARGVLQGSLRSRRHLVVCWLLALFSLAAFKGASAVGLAGTATAIAAGLFTLHVLLWRKGAGRAIAANETEAPTRRKWLSGAAAALAMLAGFAYGDTDSASIFSGSLRGNATVFYSHGSNEIKARLERLWLFAGSPDETTHLAVEELAGRLRKGLRIPVETVRYDGEAPRIDFWREYGFVILRGTTAPPGKPEMMKETIGKEKTELSVPLPTSPIPKEFAGSPAFRLIPLRLNIYGNFLYRGIVPPPLAFSCSGVVMLRPGSEKMLGRHAAAEFAAKLIPTLRASTLPENTVAMPKLPVFDEEPVSFPIPAVKNFRCIARLSGGQYRDLAVYRFDRTSRQQDLDAIAGALAQSGFAIDYEQSETRFRDSEFRRNALLFHEAKKPNNSFLFAAPEVATTTGLLFVAAERHGSEKDPAFLREFARTDLRGFCLSRGLYLLPETEQRELANRFFALPGTSWDERYCVLDTLNAKSSLLLPVFEKLAQETAQSESVTFAPQAIRLFGFAIRSKEQSESLLAVLRKVFERHLVIVTVPSPREVGGTAELATAIPITDLLKVRRLIEFRFADPDYLPVWLGVGTGKGAQGISFRMSTPNISSSSEAAGEKQLAGGFHALTWSCDNYGQKLPKPYRLIGRQLSSGKYTPGAPYHLSLSEPDQCLETVIGFDRALRTLTLELMFRPQKGE